MVPGGIYPLHPLAMPLSFSQDGGGYSGNASHWDFKWKNLEAELFATMLLLSRNRDVSTEREHKKTKAGSKPTVYPAISV